MSKVDYIKYAIEQRFSDSRYSFIDTATVDAICNDKCSALYQDTATDINKVIELSKNIPNLIKMCSSSVAGLVTASASVVTAPAVPTLTAQCRGLYLQLKQTISEYSALIFKYNLNGQGDLSDPDKLEQELSAIEFPDKFITTITCYDAYIEFTYDFPVETGQLKIETGVKDGFYNKSMLLESLPPKSEIPIRDNTGTGVNPYLPGSTVYYRITLLSDSGNSVISGNQTLYKPNIKLSYNKSAVQPSDGTISYDFNVVISDSLLIKRSIKEVQLLVDNNAPTVIGSNFYCYTSVSLDNQSHSVSAKVIFNNLDGVDYSYNPVELVSDTITI